MTDFRREVYCILGLPFDAIDMAGLVRRIRHAVTHRQRCFLSTPNVNFLVGSCANPGFRDSVVNSDLSVADGMPLVWIARLLRIPIRERVAGSSLMEQLAADASNPLSVYFFGGAPGVAEAACATLNARPCGLRCAGFESPGFGSVEDMSRDAAIARINASGADFLVVALGAQKGQAWIEHNLHRLDVPVLSHLGAVVNFLAGTVRRAPVRLQRLGLEWLWRIKEEPQLWHRYFRDGLRLAILLVAKVIPYAWSQFGHAPSERELRLAALAVSDESGWATLRLSGAWTRINLDPLREQFERASRADLGVIMALDGVTCVDAAFVGLVMLAAADCEKRGKRLSIERASAAARRTLNHCCADHLL